MRRKATVALFLALAMVACSLSAAAAYADGYYGDSYYEVSATIDGRTVYGRTSVLNRDYEAYVFGEVYRYNTRDVYTTVGPLEEMLSVSFSADMSFVPLRLQTQHCINGVLAKTLNVYN